MEQKADLIIKNGHVLTMDSAQSVATAIAVRNGKILAVGSEDAISARASAEANVVDLRGRTILPGFIDAHSHFLLSGVLGKFCVNLRCPPVGSIRSISEILEALKKEADKTHEGVPIFGEGYVFFCQPVIFQLLWNEVAFGNFYFFFHQVAANLNQFQTVAKGWCNGT